MPVLGFTGLPGHGKSYGVVANVILPALQKGRTVVTNIPVDRDAMRSRLHADGVRGPLKLLAIDVKQFADESLTFAENIPDGAVVVIDEVWRLWPSGLKANNVPEDHKAFLAEHRHRVGDDGLTMEIVLVTQDLMQVAAFARQLVERTYVVHKLKEVGADNRYAVTIYSGIHASNRGGQEIGKSRGRYEKEIFSLYKSHTKSDAVGIEVEADSRGTVWSSAVVRFGLPAAIVLLLLGGWNILGLFQDLQGGDPGTAEAAEIPSRRFAETVVRPEEKPSSEAARPQEVGQAVPVLRDSEVWRIAGTVEDEDGAGFAYLLSDSGYRYFPLDECEQTSVVQLQYRCVVDEQIVTSWTGKRRARGLQLSSQE